MLKRRLYLKICAVVVVSLTTFALISGAIWDLLDRQRYERAIYQNTTELALLLLPSPGAGAADHQVAVDRIVDAMEFDVSIFDENRELMAASGTAAVLADVTPQPGRWINTGGEAEFTTMLPDGRWIVVQLDRFPLPDEPVIALLFFASFAVIISAVMYPFIRRMTRRLEYLQTEVQRIGAGDLSARVQVTGHDEIAVLAHSFNRTAEQLENLVQSQRLLLANTSHEIRTPLARIRMGLEILQQRDDPARRAQLMDDIAELDALIDDLLMMARLDSDRQSAVFTNVDFLALVAEECARFQVPAFTGVACELEGDERMLHCLIRNLIDNAIKHGREPVEVLIRRLDDCFELVVTDHGSGIPDKDAAHVFEPFYRGADRQNVPGYGLGLPLVQRIAVAHGGSVRIQTEPKSAIIVTFPASEKTSVADRNTPPAR